VNCPADPGGRGWPATAYSPKTGMLYLPLNEYCSNTTPTPLDPGQAYTGGGRAVYARVPVPNSDGKIGRVDAVKLADQSTAWSFRTRAPQTGAVMPTAGGLVFSGAWDRTFRAFDDTTGQVLWETRLNNVITPFPQLIIVPGRKLVVSMKVALLLEQLQADKHLQLPRVGSDVLVYVRRKKEGSYDDSDYYKWERKYLDKGITAEQVRGRQRDLLLHLDQWYFPELIDIKPAKGGAYIHATTEAYNEEGEEEQQVVKNWVEYFGFSYHQIHASGHAPIDKVAYLVNTINAKNVIPIHTERPDLFASFWKGKLSLPERGKRIQIG